MTTTPPEGPFDETPPSSDAAGVDALEAAPAGSSRSAGSEVTLQVKGRAEYINIDGSGWATYASTSTTRYVIVPYNDVFYIVVASGPYNGYYLSYNDRYYIGAYRDWTNARYWTRDPVDIVRYPGLYFYNNFLCCNGKSAAPDKLVTIVAV